MHDTLFVFCTCVKLKSHYRETSITFKHADIILFHIIHQFLISLTLKLPLCHLNNPLKINHPHSKNFLTVSIYICKHYKYFNIICCYLYRVKFSKFWDFSYRLLYFTHTKSIPNQVNSYSWNDLLNSFWHKFI